MIVHYFTGSAATRDQTRTHTHARTHTRARVSRVRGFNDDDGPRGHLESSQLAHMFQTPARRRT